jgi:hypothetical protein
MSQDTTKQVRFAKFLIYKTGKACITSSIITDHIKLNSRVNNTKLYVETLQTRLRGYHTKHNLRHYIDNKGKLVPARN